MSRHHHGQEQDQSHGQSTNRPNVCPQCGAQANQFEPSVTMYRCHFCNTEYPVLHPEHDDYGRRQREAAEREMREQERLDREETKRAEKAKEKRSNLFGALVGTLVPATVAAPVLSTAIDAMCANVESRPMQPASRY